MSKYYRKIIHMVNSNSKYLKNINKITAYYKIQIKDNHKKFQVLINDLVINDIIIYKVFLIAKNDTKYNLEYVGTLQINKEGIANKTFFIDKDKNNISGLIVAALKENEKLKRENIVFYGDNDNNKLNLDKIDFEGYAQINKNKEIDCTIKDNKNVGKYKKEITNKKECNIKNNIESNLNKNECYNKKNIVSNINNNEGYKKDENKIKEIQKTQNKKNSINEEKNLNNIENNKNKEKVNKDTKVIFSNINTLDIIKEQLEKKKELKKFDELINNKENIDPFEKAYKDVKWVKIEMTDLIFLPIESWMYINNAFLVNCYRKFKHLILGKNDDEETILLGVPDIYFIKESILANICGFKEFKCCKDTVPKAGEYGYWIIKSQL